MTNCNFPFNSSKHLAGWAAHILADRDIDCLIEWRMLEQWMQAELFRAIDTDPGTPWRHFGHGEQPYCCDIPKSLSNPTSVPRIDLVFAQPEVELPEQIIWFELKHIGRSQETLHANASNLGADLIALYSINPTKTKDLWLNPPGQVVNANKADFWKKHAHGIEKAEHFYAQVVLVQKNLVDVAGNEALIRKRWLTSFENRANLASGQHDISIERADTERFTVFALVGRVGTSRAETVGDRSLRGNWVTGEATDEAAVEGKSIGVTYGFKKLRSLGVKRDGDAPGTPVSISWKADGHIIELRYRYQYDWNFEGYFLDNRFVSLTGSFKTRDKAKEFFLSDAYKRLNA